MAFQGLAHTSAEPFGARRNLWLALRRGFVGRCPNCGVGGLFRAYLKVNPVCPMCGEELHHQRADDAPPYFTILVVGHIVGAGIVASDDALPIWVHMLIWPALTVALCLALLPRFKGALIGLQWANRMHGFGTALSASRRAPG
jgi:uncharacterized protein (DUF983 family)